LTAFLAISALVLSVPCARWRGMSLLAVCDARCLSANLLPQSLDGLLAALRFAVLDGFLQFKFLAWVLNAEIRPAASEQAIFATLAPVPLRNRQALEARDDAGNRRNGRQRDHDGLRSCKREESLRLKGVPQRKVRPRWR
jgi:hypothetical protein